MLHILLETPVDASRQLAEEARERRLRLNMTRQDLAAKSGVPPDTLGLFERTGRISLVSFLKVAFALGIADRLTGLFDSPEIASLDEIADERPKRQRARKRK